MVCQVQGCPEGSKQYLLESDANMSIASTEDTAMDSLTDEDEAPSMLSLERSSTVTEYNENRCCEWEDVQAKAAGVPLVPFACYMIPSPPLFQQHHFSTSVPCQYAYEEHRDEEDKANWSARLLAGGEQREQVLGALRGNVAELAFQQVGCRIVQDALRVASTDAARAIVSELHGHVQAAAWSPHANYVYQKVVEILPASLSGFVAQELHGVAASVARGKYGCRILCRVFEYAADQTESTQLAEELSRDAGVLCRHPFAHHVMEVILKHGLPEQRQGVVNALVAEFWSHAQNESSSYVIESAMVHCTEEELDNLVAIISNGNAAWIVSLANGKPGSRVLRALMRVQSQSSNDALRVIVRQLERYDSQWGLNRQGKRLTYELSKAAELVAVE